MSRVASGVRLPRRRPGAIIFDMDGLMLDSERVDLEIWRTTLSRHGHTLPDELHRALIGRREADGERLLLEHYGTAFPLAQIKAETRAVWHERVAAQGLPRKPGLEALLDHLEATGVPKAVATSTARARALLSLGELAHRFGALACGDEVANGKPAPDIYLLAASRLSVEVADCLALEDSPAGVTAAQSAGMAVVMIPDLVLPTTEPEFCCSSLSEVHAWLLGKGVQ